MGRDSADCARYDPRSLLTYNKLGDDRLFSLFGKVIKYVLSFDSLKKVQVVSTVDLVVESMGLGKDFYGDLRALIYNDLRRLGVITIGKGCDWHRDVAASPTPLGEYIKRCLDGVKEKLLGALPIALCYVKKWEIREDEAGFCATISRGELGEYTELVKRAVDIFIKEVPPTCITYGSHIAKAIALLTSSST
ncbi:hypothetical protein [Thermoproteus uzoniensis]|uniref:hypothetical protein n=1 Tax=Thermoproteus uzoniensis TaxID=184117 RepID=UPI00069C7C4F|nr:hypothetical protein [Thermoproteus uzoniensis]